MSDKVAFDIIEPWRRDRAPSSYAVMGAVSTLQQVADQLRVLCPDIEDDEALFSDTLEGEAPDAMAVVERLIEASIAADDLAGMAKARLADLAERKTRFERRRDAYRSVALAVMEAVNLRKLERPHFTVSLRQMPPPLLIDETALSDAWCEFKRQPRRGDIRAALAIGEEVTGAQLGNPQTGISVRTK